MSAVPTISWPSATSGITITLPDTPQSRELAAAWDRQQQRRRVAQNVLFTGRKPTPSCPEPNSIGPLSCGNATPVPVPSTSRSLNASVSEIPLSARPAPTSPSITISAGPDEAPPSEPAVRDYHIMSEILSGAGTTQRTTSRQAFDRPSVFTSEHTPSLQLSGPITAQLSGFAHDPITAQLSGFAHDCALPNALIPKQLSASVIPIQASIVRIMRTLSAALDPKHLSVSHPMIPT